MPHFTIKNGRILTHKLDFNAASHCNYSCAECSHLSPYISASTPPVDTFEADVTALSAVYHTQRLYFVGGEPLLNKNLLQLVDVARESGIADEILLITNGSLLHKTSESTIAAFDSVVVSHYPDSRFDEAKIEMARSLCLKAGTKLKIMRIDRFRRMQINRPTVDRNTVKAIFETCRIAHSMGCQTFSNGRFYLCSRPLYTSDYLRVCGADSADFSEMDGCALHEPKLLERLVHYMRRIEPLRSCQYCLGTVGRTIPWRQLSGRERKLGDRLGLDAESGIDEARRRKLRILSGLERSLYKCFPSPTTSRILAKVTQMIVSE